MNDYKYSIIKLFDMVFSSRIIYLLDKIVINPIIVWSCYIHIQSDHDKNLSILFKLFTVPSSMYVYKSNNDSFVVFYQIGTSTGTTMRRLIHFTSDTWLKVVWKVRHSLHYQIWKLLLSLYLNVTLINYTINLWVCLMQNRKARSDSTL